MKRFYNMNSKSVEAIEEMVKAIASTHSLITGRVVEEGVLP